MYMQAAVARQMHEEMLERAAQDRLASQVRALRRARRRLARAERRMSLAGGFAASILYYAAFRRVRAELGRVPHRRLALLAIRAGLAIGPGPLMVLPFAQAVPSAGRPAGRPAAWP